MKNLVNFITSRYLKKKWYVKVHYSTDLIRIEVTDPPSLLINVDELLVRAIGLVFQECNFISVSQYADNSQWNIGDKNGIYQDISNYISMPIVFTGSFESAEAINEEGEVFVMHLIGHPKYEWLRRVIGFGMDNNPNILYGLPLITKNWPSETLEWNRSFKKWFRLEANDTVLRMICEQVDLLSWTGDGHLFIEFVIGRVNVDKLLSTVTKLAEEYSLIPVIKRTYG